MLPIRHIPPLLVAIALNLGGLFLFFVPEACITESELPPSHFTISSAQIFFGAVGSRTTAFALMMWALYLQRKYAATNTILISMTYIGLADVFICWKEGSVGVAVMRGVSWLAIGGWGFFRITVGRR